MSDSIRRSYLELAALYERAGLTRWAAQLREIAR